MEVLAQAEAYLAQHELQSLFARLLSRIVAERPVNPESFLAELLEDEIRQDLKTKRVLSPEKAGQSCGSLRPALVPLPPSVEASLPELRGLIDALLRGYPVVHLDQARTLALALDQHDWGSLVLRRRHGDEAGDEAGPSYDLALLKDVQLSNASARACTFLFKDDTTLTLDFPSPQLLRECLAAIAQVAYGPVALWDVLPYIGLRDVYTCGPRPSHRHRHRPRQVQSEQAQGRAPVEDTPLAHAQPRSHSNGPSSAPPSASPAASPRPVRPEPALAQPRADSGPGPDPDPDPAVPTGSPIYSTSAVLVRLTHSPRAVDRAQEGPDSVLPSLSQVEADGDARVRRHSVALALIDEGGRMWLYWKPGQRRPLRFLTDVFIGELVPNPPANADIDALLAIAFGTFPGGKAPVTFEFPSRAERNAFVSQLKSALQRRHGQQQGRQQEQQQERTTSAPPDSKAAPPTRSSSGTSPSLAAAPSRLTPLLSVGVRACLLERTGGLLRAPRAQRTHIRLQRTGDMLCWTRDTHASPAPSGPGPAAASSTACLELACVTAVAEGGGSSTIKALARGDAAVALERCIAIKANAAAARKGRGKGKIKLLLELESPAQRDAVLAELRSLTLSRTTSATAIAHSHSHSRGHGTTAARQGVELSPVSLLSRGMRVRLLTPDSNAAPALISLQEGGLAWVSTAIPSPTNMEQRGVVEWSQLEEIIHNPSGCEARHVSLISRGAALHMEAESPEDARAITEAIARKTGAHPADRPESIPQTRMFETPIAGATPAEERWRRLMSESRWLAAFDLPPEGGPLTASPLLLSLALSSADGDRKAPSLVALFPSGRRDVWPLPDLIALLTGKRTPALQALPDADSDAAPAPDTQAANDDGLFFSLVAPAPAPVPAIATDGSNGSGRGQRALNLRAHSHAEARDWINMLRSVLDTKCNLHVAQDGRIRKRDDMTPSPSVPPSSPLSSPSHSRSSSAASFAIPAASTPSSPTSAAAPAIDIAAALDGIALMRQETKVSLFLPTMLPLRPIDGTIVLATVTDEAAGSGPLPLPSSAYILWKATGLALSGRISLADIKTVFIGGSSPIKTVAAASGLRLLLSVESRKEGFLHVAFPAATADAYRAWKGDAFRFITNKRAVQAHQAALQDCITSLQQGVRVAIEASAPATAARDAAPSALLFLAPAPAPAPHGILVWAALHADADTDADNAPPRLDASARRAAEQLPLHAISLDALRAQPSGDAALLLYGTGKAAEEAGTEEEEEVSWVIRGIDGATREKIVLALKLAQMA